MKIQDPRREHPPFDIVDGQWPLYKSQGYTAYKEVDLTPEIEVKWFVQRGRFLQDYECPPFIAWSATNGNAGYCESTKGTAHRSVKVFIPGQRPVTCPVSIGEEYVRLFNEWAAKSKKKNGEIKQPPVDRFDANFASTPKIPGVSPYAGATGQPWRHDVEFRGKE